MLFLDALAQEKYICEVLLTLVEVLYAFLVLKCEKLIDRPRSIQARTVLAKQLWSEFISFKKEYMKNAEY